MTTPNNPTVPENPSGSANCPQLPTDPRLVPWSAAYTWPPAYGSAPYVAQPYFPLFPAPPGLPVPWTPPNTALIHLPGAMQALDERYKAAESSLKRGLGELFRAGWRVFALVFLSSCVVGAAALIGVAWWGAGAVPAAEPCLLYALTAAVLIALPTAIAAALAVAIVRYLGLSVDLLKDLVGTMKDILLKP